MDEARVIAGTQSLQAETEESSKGALAREKMLRAALEVFGRFGFDGATTRMLAQQAGMNLGAIPYYFGSKEDLYAHAADYLGQRIESRLEPLRTQLVQLTAGETNRESLCDSVVTFLIAQAQTFLNRDIPISWMQFFLRAQGQGGPAFENLRRTVINPILVVLSPVIGRIIGNHHDAATTRTLTFLVVHQTLHIRLTASTLLSDDNWEQMTSAQMSKLFDTIGLAIKSQLLNFPAAPRQHP